MFFDLYVIFKRLHETVKYDDTLYENELCTNFFSTAVRNFFALGTSFVWKHFRVPVRVTGVPTMKTVISWHYTPFMVYVLRISP